MSSKLTKYVGDFETTTDTNDVRVWACCLVEIESGETILVENDIDCLFNFLKSRNSEVYFHNLKFDSSFLLQWILDQGFKYSEGGEAGTFKSLITDDGVFYSITVYFERKNKRIKKVTFYDSLKKLPFKVSQISEAFKLEDRKLHIDYKAPRPVGHVLTEEERQYVINDCRIVAQALNIQFNEGLKKMTNASDAMSDYKARLGAERFYQWFPTLPVDLDSNIRLAYKGGFTYLNPRYANIRGLKCISLDVNSLYPWVMYTKLLPWGYPNRFEGRYEKNEMFPLYIQHMYCRFRLKQDHIPTIQIKNGGRYVQTEYLTTSVDGMGSDEPVHLYLTNVDLELFFDHYDVLPPEGYSEDEMFVDGFQFKGAYNMFKEYIDYWMHIKETTTGALRQLAKLMLNSLYGKFATNPFGYKKMPYVDEFGVVRFHDLTPQFCKENGLPAPETREPVYTAMGCFITAYAREKTIRSAQSVYDRFIYADTDSLKLVGYDVPEHLEIHPTALGAWKHEGESIDSLFVRAKTYMTTTIEHKKTDTLRDYATALNRTFDVWRNPDGIEYHPIHVTCAGMPDNVKEQVTYENFHSGETFWGKLFPKRYPGGIVLEEGPFTIS